VSGHSDAVWAAKLIDKGDHWVAVAPSWRFDMEIEEDLVEEVARVYGYNNIPDVPVKANLEMTKHREANLSLKRVKTMLVDTASRKRSPTALWILKCRRCCIRAKKR
jgi:hypothetical protein